VRNAPDSLSPLSLKHEEHETAIIVSPQPASQSPINRLAVYGPADESVPDDQAHEQDEFKMVRQHSHFTPSLSPLCLNRPLHDSIESMVLAVGAVANATFPRTGPPLPPFRRRKNYIWHHFQRSLALLEQDNIPDAFQHLHRGCSAVEQYLLHPTRLILMSLFSVMGNRRWRRHPHAWLSVFRFMASMSSNLLGARHPLTHVVTYLCNWDMMRAAALPAIQAMLHVNQKQLGPAHPDVLSLRQTVSVELMRAGDLENSEACIQEACELSKKEHGLTSLARRNCMRRLGNLYVEQRRWADAEVVFENVIALDSQANGFQGPKDQTSVFTCQNLSLLNFRRGDLARSEYWAEREIDLAREIYGEDDQYYLDCLDRKAARLNGDAPEKWFSWLEIS
jgi:tetratricopeptide (TPR) repeat protein